MKQSTLIKLTLFTLLLYFKSNDLKCQATKSYIDSIKQYQAYVDSLINSYYSNPATSILHGIVHYNCLDSKGGDSGYGSGGSADIYHDPKSKTIYKLSYMKGCDSVIAERSLYFVDNKIVLAIISDKEKNQINYYQNDKYLNIDNLDAATEKFANKVVQEGYDVLKDFN